MKTKRKIILGAAAAVVLSLLIVTAVFLSLPWTNVKINSSEDILEIGKRKFSIDTLLAFSPCPSLSFLNTKDTDAPVYVVGLKGDEEIFFTVPMMKVNGESYQITWPLATDFRTLMQGINDFAGKTVYDSYHSDIQFYDSEENFYSVAFLFEDITLDVPFLIRVGRHVVGQVNGVPVYRTPD